jgi:polyisoprenoid-binding protein YceI
MTVGNVAAGARLLTSPDVSTAIAEAPAGVYNLDPSHASVTWRVAHLGLSLYTGRFDKISGALTLDPANPIASKLETAIAANSVSTGHRDGQGQAGFDAKIAKDALGAETHPTIKFVSASAVRATPNSGTITGDLTLNGVTKPVTLDVTYNGGRKHPFNGRYVVGFSGETTIKRSEFGVDDWAMAVGDDVQILIQVEFVQQQ